MSATDYTDQLNTLRQYYHSGITRSYEFRRKQLQLLRLAIIAHEQELYQALYKDLHKNPEESWVTELGIVISEIKSAIKNLRHWMKPEKVTTNLLNFPSTSRILKEPLGVVLIIAPWNYPFQLLINPLVGAIAAGNCVVLKPSEIAPATDEVVKKIITGSFPEEYVLYLQGDGAEIVPALMNNFRFDHVFYTGGTSIGKAIYKMAAEKLVPVTLELGGKSPCVVEEDANINVTARRIALSKFSNAGQMCVAPDYVLVHASKKEELVQAMKKAIHQFFGDDPVSSAEYGRIINAKQFDRLISYLPEGSIATGGDSNKEQLYISPTILLDVSPEARIMKEEIFGPLLPVIGFSTAAEAKQLIDKNPDPLAFYLFTQDKTREKDWMGSVSFGGGCVNNTALHFTNSRLPFGGKGNSGIGQYHGKYSFETFSHRKSVLKTPTWLDPDIKYPPFKGKLGLLKKIIG
jgi:aldehyde dehydrogenase (NAD+)